VTSMALFSIPSIGIRNSFADNSCVQFAMIVNFWARNRWPPVSVNSNSRSFRLCSTRIARQIPWGKRVAPRTSCQTNSE